MRIYVVCCAYAVVWCDQDKLLVFDKECTQRTHVFDAQVMGSQLCSAVLCSALPPCLSLLPACV